MIKNIIIHFFILAIVLLNFNFSFAQNENNDQGNKNVCVFLRKLKIGSKGKDVKCLQEYLKELNLFNYKPTGYYGFITRKAVLKWQEINNLSPTGIFETTSRLKYYSLISSKKENKSDFKEEEKKENFIFESNTTTNLFAISVEDKDIIIDENGVKDLGGYFQNFTLKINDSENYRNITQKMFVFSSTTPTSTILISTTSTTSTLTSTTSILTIDADKSLFKPDESFLPENFVENNLKFDSDKKEKLKEKSFLLKEMIRLQLEERKKIPVHPDIKEFHKMFIFSEALGVELLNKYLDYLDNKINEKEIKLYLDEYNKKIQQKRRNLIDEILKLSISKNLLDTIFYKFLTNLFFLLPKQTLASLPVFYPFGGKIVTNPFFCTCSWGYLIYIGPPKPVNLFVPWWFLVSPLLFMYKNILTPGVWVLGLSFYEVTIPCLIYVGTGCAPIGIGFLIFEAGTSPIPSL